MVLFLVGGAVLVTISVVGVVELVLHGASEAITSLRQLLGSDPFLAAMVRGGARLGLAFLAVTAPFSAIERTEKANDWADVDGNDLLDPHDDGPYTWIDVNGADFVVTWGAMVTGIAVVAALTYRPTGWHLPHRRPGRLPRPTRRNHPVRLARRAERLRTRRARPRPVVDPLARPAPGLAHAAPGGPAPHPFPSYGAPAPAPSPLRRPSPTRGQPPPLPPTAPPPAPVPLGPPVPAAAAPMPTPTPSPPAPEPSPPTAPDPATAETAAPPRLLATPPPPADGPEEDSDPAATPTAPVDRPPEDPILAATPTARTDLPPGEPILAATPTAPVEAPPTEPEPPAGPLPPGEDPLLAEFLPPAPTKPEPEAPPAADPLARDPDLLDAPVTDPLADADADEDEDDEGREPGP